MRITLTSLILAIVMVSTSTSGELFEFGVKAGASMAHPGSLPSDVSSTDDLAFSGGLYAQAGLGDLLAIGAELIYEGRNFAITTSYQDAGDVTTNYSTATLSIPLILKIGLPLNFMGEIGVQYSQFVSGADLITNDGQGLALLGLVWRPLDKLRIGARFQPGLSPLEIDGIDDVAMSVTHVYVAWALF